MRTFKIYSLGNCQICNTVLLTIVNSFFNKFIYFWLHWVFVAAARGLSLVAVSSGYSVAVHVLLIVVASLVAEHGL